MPKNPPNKFDKYLLNTTVITMPEKIPSETKQTMLYLQP